MAWGRGWQGRRPGPGGRPPSRRQRWAVAMAALALMLLSASWAADALLRPPLRRWAASESVNIGTRAISEAVREHLLPHIQADELFQAVTDGQGQLMLIDYDMARLNQIEAEAARFIQDALARMTKDELPVRLGQLTGLDFLAGFGPVLPVRIVPVGAVTTEPRSDFVSAGINVINHRLYVRVRVVMKVIAPYIEMDFPVEQDIVLSNQVIPGRVPQVYVGLEGMDLRRLQDGRLSLLSAAIGP
ncbi:MAG: sporulation protein YunB [Firmicutes bacterium]|nr:sporulation protein YunB [Bacillota bacterium]